MFTKLPNNIHRYGQHADTAREQDSEARDREREMEEERNPTAGLRLSGLDGGPVEQHPASETAVSTGTALFIRIVSRHIKDSNEHLFIMTQNTVQIFREIPFFRPQNDT